MPVLNEAASLGSSISNLDITGTEELIVVDGGSSDETVSIARQFTDRVYEAQTGRARVMNFGAGKASGDILLFLHADCALPDNGFNIIRSTLGRWILSGHRSPVIPVQDNRARRQLKIKGIFTYIW
jgi:glycosyltransferase involved in cell wall biosynthesis